jgi:hypothetical protein
MTLELVTAPDENVIAAPLGDDEVVRDKPMPPLDEIENAFRFADSAFSREEKAHAENISE